MSIISLRWAYSQPISNPVAKNILAFLASHNFPEHRAFFTLETICGATSYSRSSVIQGIKWLTNNHYIIKRVRQSENGRQKSNSYELNIPAKYIEKICGVYEKLCNEAVDNSVDKYEENRGGRVRELDGEGAGAAPSPLPESIGARGLDTDFSHPNNNNINNNKRNNKSFAYNSSCKKNTFNHDIKNNEIKPDVTKLSNSYSFERMMAPTQPSDILAEYMKKQGIKT